MKLHFSKANAKLVALEQKLGGKVHSFSVLSGHSCPYAKDCLSKAVKTDGKVKIEDGPLTKFRCFSASQEAIYPSLYNSNESNMEIIKVAAQDVTSAAKVISEEMPVNTKAIRIHVSGDFKTQQYFDSWMIVAKEHPSVLFYAYTKSLPFWIKRRKELPANFILTASRGGYKDGLIREYGLRQAVVVFDNKNIQAMIDSGDYTKVLHGRYKGWDIDHDDSHAALPELKHNSFALLVHGIQPKQTEANNSLQLLKKAGNHQSYTR